MLTSKPQAPGSRNIMKFAGAAAAAAVLTGCAVSMPLRHLATSSQNSPEGQFGCKTESKCPHETMNHRVAYGRSQPVRAPNLGDDPPDFILNGDDQVGPAPTTTHME
jgi:hypothetical protein